MNTSSFRPTFRMTVVSAAMGLLFSLPARGVTVANFGANLTIPTPMPGWSYLWNSDGAYGTSANYTDLIFNPDLFGPGFDAYTPELPYPSTGPASFLQIFPDSSSPNVNPGLGTSQQTSEIFQRYVIAAFTLSTSGLTSIENGLIIDEQLGSDPLGQNVDGVNISIHVNDAAPIFMESIPDGGSTTFGSINLGNLNAGDTIYVGIGSHGQEGENNDFLDSTRLDYEIIQIPEANTSLFLGLAVSASLLLRRRMLK